MNNNKKSDFASAFKYICFDACSSKNLYAFLACGSMHLFKCGLNHKPLEQSNQLTKRIKLMGNPQKKNKLRAICHKCLIFKAFFVKGKKAKFKYEIIVIFFIELHTDIQPQLSLD